MCIILFTDVLVGQCFGLSVNIDDVPSTNRLVGMFLTFPFPQNYNIDWLPRLKLYLKLSTINVESHKWYKLDYILQSSAANACCTVRGSPIAGI